MDELLREEKWKRSKRTRRQRRRKKGGRGEMTGGIREMKRKMWSRCSPHSSKFHAGQKLQHHFVFQMHIYLWLHGLWPTRDLKSKPTFTDSQRRRMNTLHFKHHFPFKTPHLNADVNKPSSVFQICLVPVQHVEAIYSVLMAGLKRTLLCRRSTEKKDNKKDTDLRSLIWSLPSERWQWNQTFLGRKCVCVGEREKEREQGSLFTPGRKSLPEPQSRF